MVRYNMFDLRNSLDTLNATWSGCAEAVVHLPQKVASFVRPEGRDYHEVSGSPALLCIHGSSDHADSADQHRIPGLSSCYA